MKFIAILRFLTAAVAALFLPFVPPSASAAAPRLLPFQGRITSADGTPVADGAKVVQFKIYDASTGGNAVWTGEVQKLTVNGGLVSTLLGSKADLSAVDFNQAIYLEITVDANADNQITAADPPLLPRQSVLPAVFAVEAASARDSSKLAGADWSSIFVDDTGATSNVPGTGFVKGSKIQTAGITATQLASNSVTSSKLASGAVANSNLAASAVTTDKILDGTIGPADLSPDLQMGIAPAGSVVAFVGNSPPPGWLLCNGAAVSRTTYPTLFGVMGNGHGSGDGTTTFNLPDYRGTFLRGVDDRPDFIVAPSAVNSSTNAISITGHAFNRTTFPVQVSNTGGTLPAPLVASITYYVIVVDSNIIKLATSEANALANTPVDITSSGTGTNTIVSWMDPNKGTRGAMATGGATGNGVGSIQGDHFKRHRHDLPTGEMVNSVVGNFLAYNGNSSGTGPPSNPSPTDTGGGGDETRPKNAYVNYIIKY